MISCSLHQIIFHFLFKTAMIERRGHLPLTERAKTSTSPQPREETLDQHLIPIRAIAQTTVERGDRENTMGETQGGSNGEDMDLEGVVTITVAEVVDIAEHTGIQIISEIHQNGPSMT